MRLITYDDIIDIFYRLQLKGSGFLGSKLTFNKLSRTQSSFNYEEAKTSNWWNIEEVRNSWNIKITGNAAVSYPEYVYQKYLKGKTDLKMLSPGCGVCSNELRFAAFPSFSEITCIDLAEQPLETARTLARKSSYTNMKFICGDVNKMEFPADFYDLVMFNASLHHFREVVKLLLDRVLPALKPDGILLINEYVGPNRLQWSKSQLKLVNELLHNGIPGKYRVRYNSGLLKSRVSGPGLLRMIFSDPSEAVDSESIVPTLRKGFTTLEETATGGNILMLLLKDIAHHFKPEDVESMTVLESLMEQENKYLEKHSSDNIFGIYKKK